MKGSQAGKTNWNFRKTLLVHLIVGSAVPVFLLAWITTISTSRGIREMYLREARRTMDQSVSLIERELKDLLEAYNTFHRLYNNFDVDTDNTNPYLSIEREQKIVRFLNDIETSFNLQDVRLFLGKKALDPEGPAPMNPSLLSIDDYPAHLSETGQKAAELFTTWLNPYLSGIVTRYHKPVLLYSLTGPLVTGGASFKPGGRIIVDKRVQVLQDLLPEQGIENSFSVITDAEGDMVAASGRTKDKQGIMERIYSIRNTYFPEEYMLYKNYYVFRHTFPINSWTLFFAFPRSQALLQGIQYARFSILALVVSILLSSVLVASFSRYQGRRFNPLIQAIKSGGINSSDPIPKLPIHTIDPSGDAIDTLAASYNDMSDRLEALIEKAFNAEHKALHYRLEALQGQINPHFIYNMLEGIQSNIALDKKETASRIIIELSQYLRLVLSHGEEEIPLSEEIQMVRGFLHLVELVYRKGCVHDISIPEDLLTHTIIRFTLQPIVENCIVHGIRNDDTALKIRITGRCQDGSMILTVTDNGTGMPAERTELLNRHLQSPGPEFHSFGLTNVQSRIRLLYGPQYGIHVSSEQGKGTTTTIICPLRKGQPDG